MSDIIPITPLPNPSATNADGLGCHAGKDQMLDAAAKADQLEIEKQRIAAQKEIAGMQVGAKTAKDKAELEAKQKLEGLRIGAQIGADKARIQTDKENLICLSLSVF